MFKDRLSEAMELRQIKATELSEKTGIAKSTLSNYMTGRMEPKSKNLNLIATALGVQEAWLMGYDVDVDRKPEQYYSEDTAAIAQDIANDRRLRLLMDAARDVDPKTIEDVHKYLLYLKSRELHEDED